MDINISKPIVIVKVHATGLDSRKDRIVGITIKRVEPGGKQRIGTRFINPECEIPQEAIAIHGITNEQVEKEKTFDQVGKNLFDFINDADIAGFGVKFDIEMLANEFARIGLEYTVYNRQVIDLSEVYRKLNPRNFKSAIAQYVDPAFNEEAGISTERYADLCGQLLEKMLMSINGTSDVKTVMSDIGVNTQMLDAYGWFSLDETKRPVFNFGKHKGKVVSEILMSEPSYYDWMRSEKSGISKDVLSIAEKIIKKAKEKAAIKA